VAALFAVTTPVLHANTIPVTRCDDNDIAGDLRHGVTAAMNGDTIDMSTLACQNGRISLHLGELATNHDIVLLGPGKDQLTITGRYYTSPSTYTVQPNRILKHTGGGTLTIKELTLTAGYSIGSAGVSGGCIYSSGSVELDHADVLYCRASINGSGTAAGGGVFTAGGLSLRYSSISGNAADASGAGSHSLRGGGATVGGNLYTFRSTISGNSALGVGSYAGGLLVFGNAMIFSSTISGNTAGGVGGGIAFRQNLGATTSVLIGNSTVSGNTSLTSAAGGIITQKTGTTINSSTIAFNTAQQGGGGSYAAGFAAQVPSNTVSATLDLHSTLIANNTYGPNAIENDLSAVNGTSSTVSITGGENLVRVTTASVPIGTISIVCPLLGPLRNNGGPTRTHALLSHSPGIDQGSNGNMLPTDQRGPPYARQSGAAADIGSYEVQQDDIIFDAGLDGCPAL
jgi:hypothetical protein